MQRGSPLTIALQSTQNPTEFFYMKGIFLRLAFQLFLMLLMVSAGSDVFGQTGKVVKPGSAGAIEIGMRIREAKNAMPGFKFERTSDGDGVALVAVKQGEEVLLTLYAGEDDAESTVKDDGIIEQIEVWNTSYRTIEGIGVGTTIKDAEEKYGPVKEIMLSEIEARQYVEFKKNPKGIVFRIDYSGVYESGKRTTKRYKTGAKIMSLIVSGDGSESNVGFYSDYTDLETECKTPEGQGEEGGHVSTYCEGPDKWRIHMFDTAMMLEIMVQSEESRSNISVARESLSFSTKGKKMEWRFKSGEPFAVILRVNSYRMDDGGLIKYPAEITGEFLFVRGLPGFESLNDEVNVRATRFANEEARRIADEGYIKVKFPGPQDSVTVDTSDLNLLIVTAVNKGEVWVKSPMQVAARIAGEFAEMRARKMYFDAPSGEGWEAFTLSVVNEGLMDDSVKSEKWVFELIRESTGVWKVSSAKKSWACWPGRGHEGFSAALCI